MHSPRENCFRLFLAAGTWAGLERFAMAADPVARESTASTVVPPLPLFPGELEPAVPAATSAIPEPVYLAVFGTGLLLLLRRRRS
jgi:uncharacterized protein (TIGR03382 family)